MTVSQLIEKLRKYRSDTEVFVWDDTGSATECVRVVEYLRSYVSGREMGKHYIFLDGEYSAYETE